MRAFAASALCLLSFCVTEPSTAQSIVLRPVGQLDLGRGAEIAAYDPATRRLFVVDGSATIEIVSLAEPWKPTKAGLLDVASLGAGANSVAFKDGVLAVAIAAADTQAPGRVAFYDTQGRLLSSVTVGSLPDMVTFTPDGSKVLVANEGEPLDYCAPGLANDPEGSVSVIDVTGGFANLTQAAVRTATFRAFDNAIPAGVRVFGPTATLAQDVEPEYIAVSADSKTAWVTLQENNAVAVVDLATATVSAIVGLGTKDHSLTANALDASDRDNAIRIVPQPVLGLFQPDAIAAYPTNEGTFLVTVNEGDSRDYDCYSEEERIGDLDLDPTVFPNAAALQASGELGRLRVTNTAGDLDGDGDYDALWSFGARSLSIWSSAGELVWDSGKDFETILASSARETFNGGFDGVDTRSDDRGPEAEGVAVGFFRGRHYAFAALERTNGLMVYDVTEPRRPFFVQAVDNLKADGTPEVGTKADVGPEGVLFLAGSDSPNGRALVVVTNEVSGTVTIYSVLPRTSP